MLQSTKEEFKRCRSGVDGRYWAGCNPPKRNLNNFRYPVKLLSVKLQSTKEEFKPCIQHILIFYIHGCNPPKRNLNTINFSFSMIFLCCNPPKRNLNSNFPSWENINIELQSTKEEFKHYWSWSAITSITSLQSTKEEFKPVPTSSLALLKSGCNPPKRNLNTRNRTIPIISDSVAIHQRGI